MKMTLSVCRWVLAAGILSALPLAATAAEKTNLYVTAKEIAAMPRCAATLAKKLSSYSASFTNADGEAFVLGDARGEQEVWHFVGALKEGQSYRFPDTFANYEKAPHYGTAKEIAAMPPCAGVVASRTPCSSCFTTADGKFFSIGDPGSGPQISQFLWSLKDGETNKFPAVFIEYQKRPQTKRP
jgi:hypothetical protein